MRSSKETTLTLESIDKYRNWCIARGQSENTAKAYCGDLKEFLKVTGEPIQESGTLMLENLKVEMEDYEELAMSWLNLTRKEVAPRTTGRRLTSLRSFAKWCGRAVLDEYNAPKPGKATPHPIPEGIAGIEKMVTFARNSEQEALLGLCGYAGLRNHEALACTIKWFDLSAMQLTVRGKGDKTRIIPISSRCWSAVCSAYVDAMSRGDGVLVRYQDRSARKAITTLGRKAGLSRSVSSHDLRATFATHVYDRTKDQRLVQELLGHASGATTEVYIGVVMNSMRKAVDF